MSDTAITSAGLEKEGLNSKRHGNTTHGHSVGRKVSNAYQSWSSMRQRCLSPKCEAYNNYGGRGITICERWIESFENFLEDMGNRPPGLSLERKDNNLGYCKSNCVWADIGNQNRNRRDSVKLEFSGKVKNQSEWSRELGISQVTLGKRLRSGWSVERALSTPVDPQVSPNVTRNGQTKTLHEWADENGLKQETVITRINRYGWSVEKALTTPPRINQYC